MTNLAANCYLIVTFSLPCAMICELEYSLLMIAYLVPIAGAIVAGWPTVTPLFAETYEMQANCASSQQYAAKERSSPSAGQA